MISHNRLPDGPTGVSWCRLSWSRSISKFEGGAHTGQFSGFSIKLHSQGGLVGGSKFCIWNHIKRGRQCRAKLRISSTTVRSSKMLHYSLNAKDKAYQTRQLFALYNPVSYLHRKIWRKRKGHSAAMIRIAAPTADRPVS